MADSLALAAAGLDLAGRPVGGLVRAGRAGRAVRRRPAPAADLPARLRPDLPDPGRRRAAGAAPAADPARAGRGPAGAAVGRAGHRLPAGRLRASCAPRTGGAGSPSGRWCSAPEPSGPTWPGSCASIPSWACGSRGFLDSGPPRRDLPEPSLGRPEDLAQVVAALGIRRVIVCYGDWRDEDLVAILRSCRGLPADVCVVPRLHEIGQAIPRGCLDEIWGIPLIPLRQLGRRRAAAGLKRGFDVTVAAVLLTVTLPLMLVLAGLIRLQTGQSPLFRQRRVTGLDRRAGPGSQHPEAAHHHGGGRHELELGGGPRAVHPAGPPAAGHPPGRAAAAGQRAARRHVPGRPAPRARVLRRALRPADPALRRPGPDAGRADRLGPGARAARGHLDRRAQPLRQPLHRVLVAVAGHGHPDPHRRVGRWRAWERADDRGPAPERRRAYEHPHD